MLTDREKEILDLINNGFLYVDIAKKLNISVHCVKAYVSLIRRKIKMNSIDILHKF